MSVKLTKREVFKLNKHLRIDKVINDIADIAVKDIKDGIVKHQEDIKGVSFTPLKPATKKLKRAKGYAYPEKPLYAKGRMKNVYVKKRATQNKAEAVIGTNERDRPGIGAIHQEGTDNIPQRQWFGLSKRTKSPINTAVKHHIKRALMK